METIHFELVEYHIISVTGKIPDIKKGDFQSKKVKRSDDQENINLLKIIIKKSTHEQNNNKLMAHPLDFFRLPE
jgi:hypothetical protein